MKTRIASLESDAQTLAGKLMATASLLAIERREAKRTKARDRKIKNGKIIPGPTWQERLAAA